MAAIEETRVYDPSQRVGAGYDVRRAARFSTTFTKISIDSEGRAALLVCDDGDLRVFDLDAWRTETVLDEPKSAIAREVAREYLRPSGHVTLSFTRDSRCIIVVDAAHTAMLLERSGAIRWRQPVTKPGMPVSDRLQTDWEWRGSEAYDDADVVRVIGAWTRHVETEPDGYPVFDDLFTTTKLDAKAGAIISEETHGIHPLRNEPERVSPKISCTFGIRSGVRVREERLVLDESFGEARAVSVTPDERRILVATDKAWLLLLERA